MGLLGQLLNAQHRAPLKKTENCEVSLMATNQPPSAYVPPEEELAVLTPMEVIAQNMHDRGFATLWASNNSPLVTFDDVAKRTFLIKLATTGRIAVSAAFAGVTRSTVLVHVKKDEAFAASVEEAKFYFRDLIQGEMYRRGVEGYYEEVLGGKAKDQIFKLKRYSDKQLENLGKIHIKEMQKEGPSTTINNNSGDTQVLSSQFDMAEMPAEDMADLKRLLQNQQKRRETAIEDHTADNAAIEGKVLPNEQ